MINIRRQHGFSMAWFLVTMPALLVFMGLVLDMGVMMLRHQQLDSATDAAALAATDAWDREFWKWSGKVIIDPTKAETLAREYLAKNLPGARVTKVRVDPSNRVHVETEMMVPFFFLRILDWTEKPVESYSTAVRGN
ncbi:MAG: pilus assembly protein TadG-related protein [Bacillota bacterium]